MKLKQESERSSLNNPYRSSRIRSIILLLFFLHTFLFACTDKPSETTSNSEEQTKAYTLSELNSLLAKDSTNAALLNQRAKKFLENKQPKEAFIDASKATLLDSTKADYFITAADVLLSINRTFNAKYALEKAISIDPNHEEANLKLAELYYIIRQYDKSMKQVETVLRNHPKNTKALFIKAMSFKEVGDTLAAINIFQKIIETDQDNYDSFMQLGVIYTQLNNPVAVDYFSNAIRINPESEEAMYGKAYFFQTNNELDRAIQEFTSMIEKDSCSLRAHFNLGYIHLVELQVYRQAIKHFDDAIACNPSFTKAIYNKGVSFESLGDISNAKKYFEQALSVDANYQPAKEGIKRLQ